MKHIVRVIVWGAVGLIALYGLLAPILGVSFYKMVPLSNDPLTDSVAVASVSGDRLTLEDGRVIAMAGYTSDELERDIRNSDGRIELQTDGDIASVHIKKRRFICGFGAPLIVIPIVRSEYPAFERRYIGVGFLQ